MHTSKQVVLAVAIFLPWLVAMLAVQVTAVARLASKHSWPWLLFWKRWDLFHLCPTFSFFSWLPTAHYHLFIHDLYLGEEWSCWRLVPLPRRSLLRLFWNPARRVRFALEDASRAFLPHLGRSACKGENISLDCFAYRYLSQFALSQASSPLTLRRQFMMAQAKTLSPDQPAMPLFLSPLLPMAASTPMLRTHRSVPANSGSDHAA